jgi:hypothetical protein
LRAPGELSLFEHITIYISYIYIYIYIYPRALRATPPPCLD